MTDIIYLDTVGSTNDYLRNVPTPAQGDMVVAVARYQTAGRGQGSNTWESEPGKNLLFSVLTSPQTVDIRRQFVLSMAGALALKAALDTRCGDITLKWPNDIYWRNRKISGTLIETAVAGHTITRCIYGIGLNVNQRQFTSDAPNPVSLANITGHETPTDELLHDILHHFGRYCSMATGGDEAAVEAQYNAALYRREGMHSYADTATGQVFEAQIERVSADGRLHLLTAGGQRRAFWLKEVRFVL